MNSIFTREFKALGTDVQIFLVIEPKKRKEKAEKIFNEIREIYKKKEKILSRFDQNSELSKLNSNLNIFQNASRDVLYLAEKSLEYYEKTEKYFDPRIIEILEDIGYEKSFFDEDFGKKKVLGEKYLSKNNLKNDLKIKNNQIYFGCRMDFSGISKGYITDLISIYLIKNGFQNFLIDSGGDIYAYGKNENQEKWGIEIEGIPKEKIILILENSAVATSGITRRKWEIRGKKYHHLINPMYPYNFSFNLKSVTVVDKMCEKADVFAKVLYMMGIEAGMNFAKEKNIASLFLDYRGNIYLSEKMKKIHPVK